MAIAIVIFVLIKRPMQKKYTKKPKIEPTVPGAFVIFPAPKNMEKMARPIIKISIFFVVTRSTLDDKFLKTPDKKQKRSIARSGARRHKEGGDKD